MKSENSEGIDKTFGTLKKVTLDKTTYTLKLNKQPTPKDVYLELNQHEMTLSFKNKASDPNFKHSFGYKQVYKYTLLLTKEEEALCTPEHKLAFKLFLENKCILFFCRSVFDLKMWIQDYKKFFDKKTAIMKFLHNKRFSVQKRKSELEEENNLNNYNGISNRIEFWKYLEKHLLNCSESFLCGGDIKNEFHYFPLNVKIQKKRSNSFDKIYVRNKTSSMQKAIRFYNRPNNNIIFYKSKILRNMHLSGAFLPKKESKEKVQNKNKLHFLFHSLINKNLQFLIKYNLRYICKAFKDFHKALKEYSLIWTASNMQREMEEEWEFFTNQELGEMKPVIIHKEELKREVVLLEDPNKEDSQSNINLSDINELAYDKEIRGKTMREAFFVNEKDFILNRPHFNENVNFQNVSKKQRNYNEEDRHNENLRTTYNYNKIIPGNYQENLNPEEKKEHNIIKKSKHIRTEIQVNENLKLQTKDEEAFLLFDLNKGDPLFNQHKINPKLGIFPKPNHIQIDDDEPLDTFKDIDSMHQKGNMSLTINLDDSNDGLQIPEESKIRRPIKFIDSPHFGNIAIIAQRYNKIDNIDDWKAFIDI
jgi:hypothetical protein